jgi:serine/threonine-protein kinase
MEYVDGETLRDVLHTRGPLPLRTTVELGLDVLSALTAAHARGIIHRDLKTENLRVTPNGRAKVLDFGIAKMLNAPTTGLTAEGSVVGTPHYMSPEQVSGLAVDGRTDLYALGVMLYECVTGERPFEAEHLVQLLHKQLTVAPVLPSALRPDLPASLERVILRALEKSAAQRFVTAQEMTAALRGALGELPTAPEGQFVPAQRPMVEVATPHEVGFAPTAAPMQALATPRSAVLPAPPPAAPVSAPSLPAPVASPSSPPAGGSRTVLIAAALVAVAGVSFAVAAVALRPPAPPLAAVALPQAPTPTPVVPVVITPAAPAPTSPESAVVLPPAPAAPRTSKPPAVRAPTSVATAQPPPVPTPAPVVPPPEPAPAPVARTKTREHHQVALDIDPKNFDAVGYLARAQRLAREYMSDAVLIDFSVQGGVRRRPRRPDARARVRGGVLLPLALTERR